MPKKVLKTDLYILWGIIACLLVSSLLSYFLNIAFSNEIGYTVYEYQDGEYKKIETVYYEDGKEGSEKTTQNNRKIEPIREDMPHSKKVGCNVFLFFLNMLILYFCIYLEVNGFGRKARFKKMTENVSPPRSEPFKIGFWANTPFVLLYILLVIFKLSGGKAADGFYTVFELINTPAHPLIDIFTDFKYSPAAISWGAVALIALTLLIVPILTVTAYIFGYSNGEIVNSWIYKTDKKGKSE